MVLKCISEQLHLDDNQAFPYAPSQGINPLRNKWKELLKEKNPSLGSKEISLPVVTCALTHGLSMVGYMFADEGDEIIVADLYWENYDLVFTNTYNAELKYFNFFKNKEFDIDSLRETINTGSRGKKIVLLNFPNNPSGYTPTKEAGQKIIHVLKESAEAGNQMIVILDDAYFGLNFEDDIFTESLFAQLADLHENLLAIKIDGITKEEYAWGLRVGFITYGIKNGIKELYKALEDKTAGAVRGTISNSPHLSQSIALNAFKSEHYEKQKERNKAIIKERYLKVKEIIQEHKEYEQYFEELPFNSGYFMCIRLKNLDTDKVWQLLLDKYQTGVICYSEKNLLRIAFASTPSVQLDELFANIYSACRECASL
ncbi:MAG: aminotransferase class I/II-fold pyridoxal phosphate-dependent enzyme [Acidobacteria bacterium]|nr:aminotransferase class I/II-fold pyridoxal phosphate-dependent enzyme [Acidobacteriota bacterium]